MRNQIRSLFLVAVGLFSSVLMETVAIAADSDAPGAAPKDVVSLAGNYSGSWTSFGIDAQGQVVKRSTWTDTMKAENPTRETGRAFVTTEDVMVFEGRPNAPFKIPGKEGYLINSDGTLGEYFIETLGRTYRAQKLAKDVWTYATDASAQELAQLGFPKNATGGHVVVKVITNDAGVETHRISRVTTVNWRDNDGKERWLQFVSLQGFHKRDR